ncbi:MAG: protein kinase, partial [Candidatus Obscuribacterales bacterium]|nr:protein kinase [Candidatus Obscuribacterales bacterium]
MSKPDVKDTYRPEDLIGKTIAERYVIKEIIGEGGIGVVYKAQHTLMNRLVAIKMLRSESLQDERNRLRFQQEAQAISSMNHPNIVQIYDFGFQPDNSAFLVMDFLDGKDLDTLIQDSGYLTPDEVVP